MLTVRHSVRASILFLIPSARSGHLMNNKSTLEAELAKNGRIVYPNKGTSMLPLIRQNKDLMIIEKPQGRIKRYDAVLYVRKRDGAYILHRVLRVKEDGYVICGDNCTRFEWGITDEDIIGVLTGVIRNGKELKATDFKYRLYVHLWCDLIFIRLPLTYICRCCILGLRKIKRIFVKKL